VSTLGAVEAHAAALAGLPGMTPVRLAKITDGFSPVTAWSAIRAGTHPADAGRRFLRSARATDVDEVASRYAGTGVTVLVPGSAAYPDSLAGDPGAPAVLFALGDPAVLEHTPRVAIVGTRSATPYGRQVASELAADLVVDGVSIVSGLARGIDAAAHAGVVRATDDGAAPPVAVVGTGLDEIYPASSRDLWEAVAARGVVLAESPLGTKPHPRVFPARNRIIAALSDVVVVVESHHGGGSLYTAEAAARRSIPVCAVPGSVRSASSAGTNGLLVDGCIPVRDATDVLVALSLARTGRGAPPCRSAPAVSNHRPSPGHSRAVEPKGDSKRALRPVHDAAASPGLSKPELTVLHALDDTPTAFETILLRTSLSIASAAEACGSLVEQGAALSGPGWWCRS